MVDVIVCAIQWLGALFVVFGGGLCLWHVADPVEADADSAMASTFSFAEANDFEPGFRNKAWHYCAHRAPVSHTS